MSPFFGPFKNGFNKDSCGYLHVTLKTLTMTVGVNGPSAMIVFYFRLHIFTPTTYPSSDIERTSCAPICRAVSEKRSTKTFTSAVEKQGGPLLA